MEGPFWPLAVSRGELEDLSDSRLFMLVEHLKHRMLFWNMPGDVNLPVLALIRYRGVWLRGFRLVLQRSIVGQIC